MNPILEKLVDFGAYTARGVAIFGYLAAPIYYGLKALPSTEVPVAKVRFMDKDELTSNSAYANFLDTKTALRTILKAYANGKLDAEEFPPDELGTPWDYAGPGFNDFVDWDELGNPLKPVGPDDKYFEKMVRVIIDSRNALGKAHQIIESYKTEASNLEKLGNLGILNVKLSQGLDSLANMLRQEYESLNNLDLSSKWGMQLVDVTRAYMDYISELEDSGYLHELQVLEAQKLGESNNATLSTNTVLMGGTIDIILLVLFSKYNLWSIFGYESASKRREEDLVAPESKT